LKNKLLHLFHFLVILFFLTSCSFDNKTGIWKNDGNITTKDNDLFSEFKKISSSENIFYSKINLEKNYRFKILAPINNQQWRDPFYGKNNNFPNFIYKNLNEIYFKSSKITKHEINKQILYEDNNLIVSDQKGNIIAFSVKENEIISKLNFYKKKYKKIKKKLNITVENNIIYISDSLGFLYAYNYKINKILWAKNYKIPFRSNVKIVKDKIIASNQNNDLIFFDKKNGDIIENFPTEETALKNQFRNNLSIHRDETLFFLNSYGSLYSFDIKNLKLNWFINLNPSVELNPGTLFFGSQIVLNEKYIVISTTKGVYIIDIFTGNIINKKKISLLIKPIIHNDYVFLITTNNLLVAISLINNKILYSYDINDKIAQYFKINKKKNEVNVKSLMLLNDNIVVFLKNSYLLIFENSGNLKDVRKLPRKINSYPILIDKNIMYLDTNNKLTILN
jgi:outer membrane protein assembly factor BamB